MVIVSKISRSGSGYLGGIQNSNQKNAEIHDIVEILHLNDVINRIYVTK